MVTDGICALCGTDDRVRVASRSRRQPWTACRRCLHRATVLARRSYSAADLARRIDQAHANGYEVWTSDRHVYVLGQDEAAHLQAPRLQAIAAV